MSDQEAGGFNHLVTHVEFNAFRNEIREQFRDLREDMDKRKQPLTAFAGWAAVILTLVGAVLWPRLEADKMHFSAIQNLEANALDDARTRGIFEERFRTLNEGINSALTNRKDLHDQLTQKANSIEAELNNVRHELNNGIGNRMREIMAPVETDVNWLMAQINKGCVNCAPSSEKE